MEDFNFGLIDDPRSQAEKNCDWKASDLYGDMPINWIEKKPSEWKKYTPREQNGSLSCVAQSAAKAIEIMDTLLYK